MWPFRKQQNNSATSNTRPELLSLQQLIALQQHAKTFDLTARRRVVTQQAGNYHSSFRGRGMDFEEARIYQPGDDIRLMDWRVTARSGKAHCKVFRQERERPVLFLVDQSTNMLFGSQVTLKSVIAAQATALLAWSANQQGDRVGGLLFSGKQHIEIRPRSRNLGMQPLLKNLHKTCQASNTSAHPQALESALLRLRRVARPGSMVFILSDFLHLTTHAEQLIGLLAKQCEVVSILISDPLEQFAPPANEYQVSDGQQLLPISTRDNQFCQQYKNRFTQHIEHVENCLQKYRIPLLQLSTEKNCIKQLQTYFAKRGKHHGG